MLVLGLLGLTAFTYGLLTAVAAQIPALDPAKQPEANTTIYANDGKTILAVLRGSQARVIDTPDQIAPVIDHAIVAIEDKRFYEHHGIDLHGILRAVWADIRGKPVQGGSTITQQFVKNTINGNAPTITRKLKEAALAWQLEQHWSKTRILTAYLNTIYFGNGAYGVEEACRIYFGHHANNVTPAEAALLAGIPEDPTLYDPVAHPKAALERRNLVLKQMYLQHYLDHSQYTAGIRAKMPKPGTIHLSTGLTHWAPYFTNYVINQLVGKYGPQKTFGGGLKVTSTIDLGLQKLARQAISETLPASVGPTAALVTINVHTGAVIAMVGGRSYHESQFNLATQGERQPGSAFKPFVLAAALAAGISPSSTLVSAPIVLDAGGRAWKVDNFEHESLGLIDLNKAIAYSDNTVFAQLTNLIGPKAVVSMAQAMGITSPLKPYFSIGLGAEPATPLEMARAYTTLADGGDRLDSLLFQNEPLAVASVTFPGEQNPTYNTVVPKPIAGLAGKNEFESDNAYIEDQMLQGVVTYGTGTRAQIPGWQVSGKTGTTENYGDAWFVGFTPDLVTAVWVGYPNNLVPMTYQYHGHAVEGGTYPALIWKYFMEKAIAYYKLSPSTLPAGLVPYSTPAKVIYRDPPGAMELDNGNCRLADTMDFFPGMAPTLTANCKYDEVEVPDVRGTTLATAQARLIGQPLTAQVVYRPAKPGERLGVVLDQFPKGGTLSAYQPVRLVLARAMHGIVPKVIGLTVPLAQARLARVKMHAAIFGKTQGTVIAQNPRPGVAAGPGLPILITVRRQEKHG